MKALILNYIIAVLESFCFLFLLRFFFLPQLKINRITVLITILLTFTGVLLLPWLPFYNSLAYITTLIPIVAILYSFPKRWRKLGYLIPAYFVYLVPSLLITFLDFSLRFRFYAKFHNDIDLLAQHIIGSYDTFNSGKIMQLVIYLLLLIYLTQKSRKIEVKASLSFLDILIAFIAGVIGFILLSLLLSLPALAQMTQDTTELLYLLGGLCGALFEGVVFLFLIRSRFSNYYNNLQKLKEGYLQLQVKQFDDYKWRQTELRKLRHDLKNHFSVLNTLAREENYAELTNYLSQLTQQFESRAPRFQTGNTIFDALLMEKIQQAEKQQIALTLDGSFVTKLTFSPMDVCTVFANALDNALEAARQTSEPFVEISIKQTDFYQLCILKNAALPPKKVGFRFLTTKSDPYQHGFGLMNIADVMAKNHGLMQTEYTPDGTFQLTLVFPYKGSAS